MLLTLTNQEIQFLTNYLINRTQDSTTTSPSDQEKNQIRGIVLRLQGINSDFTPQDIGYLQYVLQEAAEINGAQRTTANEKKPIAPGTKFFPHSTMVFIKSISDKLGARLIVDITTVSDQMVARAEGSPYIMTDPTIKRTPGS